MSHLLILALVLLSCWLSWRWGYQRGQAAGQVIRPRSNVYVDIDVVRDVIEQEGWTVIKNTPVVAEPPPCKH